MFENCSANKTAIDEKHDADKHEAKAGARRFFLGNQENFPSDWSFKKYIADASDEKTINSDKIPLIGTVR